MEDIVGVWSQFRDPDTGLWCDTLRFTSGTGLAVYSGSVLYNKDKEGWKTEYLINSRAEYIEPEPQELRLRAVPATTSTLRLGQGWAW